LVAPMRLLLHSLSRPLGSSMTRTETPWLVKAELILAIRRSMLPPVKPLRTMARVSRPPVVSERAFSIDRTGRGAPMPYVLAGTKRFFAKDRNHANTMGRTAARRIVVKGCLTRPIRIFFQTITLH